MFFFYIALDDSDGTSDMGNYLGTQGLSLSGFIAIYSTRPSIRVWRRKEMCRGATGNKIVATRWGLVLLLSTMLMDERCVTDADVEELVERYTDYCMVLLFRFLFIFELEILSNAWARSCWGMAHLWESRGSCQLCDEELIRKWFGQCSSCVLAWGLVIPLSPWRYISEVCFLATDHESGIESWLRLWKAGGSRYCCSDTAMFPVRASSVSFVFTFLNLPKAEALG